jgi:hypothetical protein
MVRTRRGSAALVGVTLTAREDAPLELPPALRLVHVLHAQRVDELRASLQRDEDAYR